MPMNRQTYIAHGQGYRVDGVDVAQETERN